MVMIMAGALALFFFGVDAFFSTLVKFLLGLLGKPSPTPRVQTKHMSRWYIIHAYSGFENKVRESIQSEAKRLGSSASSSRSRSRPRPSPRSSAARRFSPSASSCPATSSPSSS